MHRNLKPFFAFLVFAAAGCSTDLGSGPATTFGGVKYTAEVDDIVSQNGARQFTVIVTLTNTGTAVQTRTYPASCPVHIRLYRAADNALVYDEDQRTCPADPTATIQIDALASKTLQSGVRFPSSVLGDSLPSASYTVRASVHTEGTAEVLIFAGNVTL